MTVDPYRRQKLNPWLGEEGQRRLHEASVLITRVGGLGGPLAQSLALAGVGRIVFHHEGVLQPEDCHRMLLMDPTRIGEPRAALAARSLRRLRPDLVVEANDSRIDENSARRAIEDCDLAVGAAPTFEERLILNDAARRAGRPYVDAAMYADEGSVMVVHPREGACLRCLVPEPPPWRSDFPVIAAVSATIGNLAAWLALRILCGAADVPWGQYLHFDLPAMSVKKVEVPQRPACNGCGVSS